MKGISHFISGVAAASFCPWTVQAAIDGNPLYFILGGAFGILPDTADFKFYRFFYRHDFQIEPDPKNVDPQLIADTIAKAIDQAHDTKKTVRLKLTTVKLGADYWQQYTIRFDAEKQEVVVTLGPVVNTGQVPVPGTSPDQPKVGRATPKCRFVQTYEATTKVDIFDGPSFALEPDAEGRVFLQFLPWHRNWSHSLVVGAIFALIGWLAWNWQAAVVIFSAYAVHVLEDQLGHLGSNLFFPITPKRRTPGLHWMHSGDAIPNFTTVWTCCLLIFWNLYRYMPDPQYHFGFVRLMLYGGVIPMTVYGVLFKLLAGRREAEEADADEEWSDPMVS